MMDLNVLVVVLDALRVDRVGCFGGRDLTPEIDHLADGSALFTNAFSTTNTTDPAVTSIQTGRYPLSHGVVNHGRQVTGEEKRAVEQVPQLPQVLSVAGYRTGKFGRPLGRWHRQGFERYPTEMEGRRSFDSGGWGQWKHRAGERLGSVHPAVKSTVASAYRNLVEPVERRIASGTDDVPPWDEQTDDVLANFSEFIERGDPFYSFVHLMDTHGPYEVPPQEIAAQLDQYQYDVGAAEYEGWEIPDAFHAKILDGEYPELREKYYYPDGTPSTAVIDAAYDACVRRTDERVGNVLDALRERTLLDETLVVVLADHGESLTEHGIFYDHHGLYDVSTHVPMLVRPPGGADGTVDEFVQVTDIAPTIADYLDVEGLEPDGQSLRGIIEDGDTIDREFVIADEAHTTRRRMVRTTEEKLIYLLEGDTVCRYCDVEHAPAVELYDLLEDPEERTNRAEERSDRVDELRATGEHLGEDLSKRCPVADGDESVTYEDEEEVHERLEALGYK